MNILSLFDGISCGRVALDRAGVPVTNYFASEIDKHAITVSRKNWPGIVQLGDVTKLTDWFIQNVLPRIDVVIAGSPCQGFSFAGKQLNFNDPRSKLFFDFVRIWKACKLRNPDCKFLLENVPMKGEYRDVITSYVGVSPVMINSNLVSAQNRRRWYWTDICGIQQPADRGIYLKDIVLPDALPLTYTEARTEEAKRIRSESMKAGRDFSPRRGKQLVVRTDGKSNCLTATFSEKEHMVALGDTDTGCIQIGVANGINGHDLLRRIYSVEGKAPTLTAICGGNQEKKIAVDELHWRKLHPIECERLQGLPDNYTSGISDTQRYKSLGNGWQVDTVAHIFQNLKPQIIK